MKQTKMKTLLLFTISVWLMTAGGVYSQSACPTQYLTANPSASGERIYLNSPLYPHFYDNNIDCWWIIRSARPDQRIKLTVFDFMTEACCDKLWVFNSSSADRNKEFAVNVLSGSVRQPYHVISPSNVIALNFITNSDTALRGFRISYESTEDLETPTVNIPDDFDFPTITSISGIGGESPCSNVNLDAINSVEDFSSPGYPGKYSNNLDCNWSITASRGQLVQMSFDFMDLETCCDRLQIKEGNKVVGSFPEDFSLKRTYVSTSSQGFIVSMKTDQSVGRDGFHAIYRSVSPSHANQPLPAAAACYEDVEAVDRKTWITSPGWPVSYPLNTTCVWDVTTSHQDFIIELTIEEGEFDRCCDYLQITEANGDTNRYFDINESVVLESKSSSMKILFFSDSSVVSKGFKASIKQVPRSLTSTALTPTTSEENLVKQLINVESHPPDVNQKICPIPDLTDVCIRVPPWTIQREAYECGFDAIASDEVQIFNSPGFPASYGPDQRCRWQISAPEGFLVQLSIGYFETELCCDNLKIWGSEEIEIRLAGSFRSDRSYISANQSGFIVTFRSDSSIQMGGFRGLFRRVSVDQAVEPLQIRPRCGNTIEVEDLLQTLTSPGWPDNYSDNLDCYWNLTTGSAGKEIELVIYNFSTEACCDYLEVAGTNSTTRIKGTLQKPRRILSNGRNLQLHFFSDRSKSDAGFNATIRQIDAQSNKVSASGLQENIGECKFELAASSEVQNLTTPSFPYPYKPNMDCVWIIKPQGNSTLVKVVVEELSTESCCDFLDVYILENEGYDRLRGEISAPRQFTGKSIILRFFSDGTDQRRGLKASYTSINLKTEKLNETRAHKNITAEICGSTYNATENSQMITSPGWPKQYDNDLNCIWTLKATRPNFVVELTLIVIDSEACCDYLEVTGGNETRRFKGSIKGPYAVMSSGNQLTLKFVTDSNRRQQGFKVEFREVEPESRKVVIPVSGKNNCTRNLQATGDYQEVKSNNFPENYDSNQDCVWIIQSSSPRKLVEVIMEEVSTEECCDYLEIYPGKSGYERIKGSLDGTKTYQAPYVVVRFFSDGNIQHRGFWFTYRTVEASTHIHQVVETTDWEDTCQHEVVATTDKQEIKSSENTLLYPSLTNCTWAISALENQKIVLNFTFIETEECCDYIEVFEGTQLKANLSGSINFYSITSASNQLSMRFISDGSINMQGFVADVKAVHNDAIEDEDKTRIVDPLLTTIAPITNQYTTVSEKDKDDQASQIEKIIYPPCNETMIVGDEPILIGSVNYPEPYDPAIDCHSVFESHNGRRLSITFHEVAMEECCDYIDLIDQPSGRRLAKMNMEKLHNNLTYVSIGHRVSVVMSSDMNNQLGGYMATIQILPEEDCYETLILSRGSPLRLTSRNFPENYPNKNCTWRILNEDPTKQIRMTFSKLILEECCDSLQLFDGHEERFMSALPKAGADNIFETSTSLLTVKMLVDKSVTKKGFNSTLESFQESYHMLEQRGCGSTIIVKDGEEALLSPNYPETFQSKLNCQWLIKVDDPLNSVSFFFDEIEIYDCCSEIKVYDGPGTNYPLLARIDKYNIPNDFLFSTSNAILLVLESAEENAHGMFFASFFQDTIDREGCDRRLAVLDSPTPLSSKGYPLTYQHQTNCTWELVAEEGKRVELVIEDIEMETCCDYIEITDGKERRLIRKVNSMGESKKFLYRSTTSTMNIRMFSDRSIGGRGFKAIFQSVQDYFDPDACGYTSYLNEDDFKSITTPNYPNNYPANAECHWLLLPKDGKGQVQLRIDDARMEECCDSLQVRNGYDIDADIVGVIDGYVGPEGREYTSTNGALHIRFQSDISGNYHGFHGKYFIGGTASLYSHVCTRIERLESDRVNIDNNYVEDCKFGSNCFQITSNSISAHFNENGITTNGDIGYGGCIAASDCESLTCDHLSNLQFQKHNISVTNHDQNCSISCCSGDLCNTAGSGPETTCRETSLDLMFLMDGSGSLTDDEFEKQKFFVDEVSSKFDLNRVHVGIMQYSHWFKWSPLTSEAQSYFETHISMGNYTSYSQFSQALSTVKPHGYTAYVGHAVEKAILEDMTTSKRFLDQCTKKAMVVLIDGKASDSRYLKASNRQAKTFNIELFGVGVDQYRRAELQLLVNGKRGSNDNIFTARNFNKLSNLVDPLFVSLEKLL